MGERRGAQSLRGPSERDAQVRSRRIAEGWPGRRRRLLGVRSSARAAHPPGAVTTVTALLGRTTPLLGRHAPPSSEHVPSRPRRAQGDGRAALLFILPALVGLVVFYLIPLVRGLYNSLTDYNILQSPTFIGVQNYQSLLHDDIFWNSL